MARLGGVAGCGDVHCGGDSSGTIWTVGQQYPNLVRLRLDPVTVLLDSVDR